MSGDLPKRKEALGPKSSGDRRAAWWALIAFAVWAFLPSRNPPKVARGVVFVESVRDVEAIFTGRWTVTPVAESVRADVRARIDIAMRGYPKRLLDDGLLGGVFVAAGMTSNGVAIGGTNSASERLVLVGTARDPKWVERSFHHEFLHVCLLRHADAFPKAEWLATNPPGFRYLYGSGQKALRENGLGVEWDAEAQRRGFANAYGASAFEEDVATVSEMVMGDAPLVTQYGDVARLKAKARLLIRFFQRLDPEFRPPVSFTNSV